MINPLDQTVSPPALNAAQSQVGWAHGHRRQFFLRPRFLGIAAVLLLAVSTRRFRPTRSLSMSLGVVLELPRSTAIGPSTR